VSVDHGTRRLGGHSGPDVAGLAARALDRVRALLPQFSRYAAVSALALGLDFSVFLALNAAIGHPTLSGVAGYACGIVLHYQLSRHFVFATAGSAKSTHRRFGEFVASGLVGLAVTAVVIAALTGMGAGPIIAKVMAAGASFVGVYAIRRAIVFA
jgi:putative flippase GtrA